MLMFWDEPKRETNLEDHGLDFADAGDRFEWGTAQIGDTHPGKDGRARFLAIGFLDDDLVALTFSLLGTEALSAISLRPASKKERRQYGE